jgi:hypothetical protein
MPRSPARRSPPARPYPATARPANGHERPAPQYASVKIAAERFDVDPRTVRRWAAAGLITSYRVGSTLIKVDLNEIEDRIVQVIPASEARP